jgi:hypothetical protein
LHHPRSLLLPGTLHSYSSQSNRKIKGGQDLDVTRNKARFQQEPRMRGSTIRRKGIVEKVYEYIIHPIIENKSILGEQQHE